MAESGYHGIFSARPAPDRRHNRGLRRKLLFCPLHRQNVEEITMEQKYTKEAADPQNMAAEMREFAEMLI